MSDMRHKWKQHISHPSTQEKSSSGPSSPSHILFFPQVFSTDSIASSNGSLSLVTADFRHYLVDKALNLLAPTPG